MTNISKPPGLDSPRLPTKSRQRFWLLNDDDDALRQTQLASHHFLTTCFQPRSYLSTVQSERLLQQIAQQQPLVLWARLLGSSTALGSRSDLRVSWHVNHLATSQLNAKRHFLVEGDSKLSSWDHHGMTSLAKANGVYKSLQRWCRYGITSPRSGLPSGRVTTFLTTFILPDNSQCFCGGNHHSRRGGQAHDGGDDNDMKRQFQQLFCTQSLFMSLEAAGAQPESKYHVDTGEHLVQTVDLSDTALAYPTEARLRQKQKLQEEKAEAVSKGVEYQKRRIPRAPAEQHYDDCGASLSSIDLPDGHHWIDECQSGFVLDDAPVMTFVDEMFLAKLADPACFFFGQIVEGRSVARDPRAKWYLDFDALLSYWKQQGNAGPYTDIMEVCGGNARVTQVCVRRLSREGIFAGRNFDAVCGCDLTDDDDVRGLWRYLIATKPMIIVMSPPCTGLRGYSAVNRVYNHDAWAKSRETSVPIGNLCGNIALYQLHEGRHFLVEQPLGSEMFTFKPWLRVNDKPSVCRIRLDQCATDLKARNGKFVKKPTEFRASSVLLLWPLRGLLCPGDHEHEECRGRTAKEAQHWTWQLASCIAAGCIDLLREKWFAAYPETAVGPEPPAESRQVRWRCVACRRHQHRNDPAHTRDPAADGCKFPLDAPIDYTCPGCKRRRPAESPEHTLVHGECRIVGDFHGRPRAGQHPRDPRVPESSEPTAVRRLERGLTGEEQVVHDSAAPAASAAEPSSSSGAASSREPVAASASMEVPTDGGEETEPTTAAGGERPVNTRNRIVKADAGTQADTDASWTDFDVGRSLSLLRSNQPGVVRRVLRRLHIRLWHAPAARMLDLLTKAGLPKETLDMIPAIVDTCRVCREWSSVAPRAMTSAKIVEHFNEAVQFDIVFWRKNAVGHLCDSCLRFSQADFLDTRSRADVLNMITFIWIRQYGPPELLISDREGALDSDEGRSWADRWGIQLRFRPTGSKA